MAAYGPACDRIRYLIGMSNRAKYSPATISGGADAVYSYRLKIGEKRNGIWRVHPPTSTPTTNRHIRALFMVLTDDHQTYTIMDA